MPDYKELIERLRSDTQIVHNGLCLGSILATEKEQEAATAIETLMAQLAAVRGERDAENKRIIELEQAMTHSNEGLGIYESCIARFENEKENMRKELDRVKAERDAAVEDLRKLAYAHCTCYACANEFDYTKDVCVNCHHNNLGDWEWRGVKEES